MKKFYEEGKYEQWIEFYKGVVISFNCTCMNFTLYGTNKGLRPCKHLKEIFKKEKCKISEGIIK